MRVIIGADSFDIDAHAQKILRAQNNREEKLGGNPIGIAITLTRFVHICENCQLMFWDRDEYGFQHPGCKGYKEGKVGF